MKKVPDNQIAFYQSLDGSVNIEVLYVNENVWLTQKRMAELFDVNRTVITKHLANIFKERELDDIQLVQILHILPMIFLPG